MLVDAVRYSFIVMDLHHLLLAGFPAHSGLPQATDIVRPARLVRLVPIPVVHAMQMTRLEERQFHLIKLRLG
jgi:hypothetical protein